MKFIADFGVVTACHQSDLPFARAACASIRHQMPDVPVALIVDGDVNVSDIVRIHGVIPLPVRSLTDPRLVQACYGNFYAKWTAFWAAPFKRFVYLDSDALLLGDWSELAHDIKWDFCIFTTGTLGSSDFEAITKHFFKPNLMAHFDPLFLWQNQPYFCAGAFAARHNFICPDDFLNFLDRARAWPHLFDGTDQGPLNYFVLKALQNGRPVIVRNYQFIVHDHPPAETLRRFGHSPRRFHKPCIVHYCGVKPWMHNRQSHHRLFHAYRWLHHRACHRPDIPGFLKALNGIAAEECQELRRKLGGRLRRACQPVFP